MKIQIIRAVILAVTVLSSVGIYCGTTQYQTRPFGPGNTLMLMWNRRNGQAWIINMRGYESPTRRGVWRTENENP